jgi:hypothetical protein
VGLASLDGGTRRSQAYKHVIKWCPTEVRQSTSGLFDMAGVRHPGVSIVCCSSAQRHP